MKLRVLILILYTTILHTSEIPTASTAETTMTMDEIKNKIGIRPLIIFFDPSRAEQDPLFHPPTTKKVGFKYTITSQLLNALEDQCAPIITSRWIWDFIIDIRTRSSAPNGREEEDDEFYKKCKSIKLDNNEWTAYTHQDTAEDKFHVNEMLLLLIPNKLYRPYIDQLDIYPAESYSPSGKNTLSIGELLLGIKMQHLQKEDNPFLLKPNHISETNGAKEGESYNNKVSEARNLPRYLKTILITRSDLKNTHTSLLNKWDIYLTAHGRSNPSAIIAGMNESYFTSCIDFLNNNIKTRSFFYASCFSGGTLLKTPYTFLNGKDLMQKELNFTIISGTLFDLPVRIKDTKPNDFCQYFAMINKYFAGNALIGQAIENFVQFSSNSLQVSAIRFPHTEWFSAVTVDDSIFQINNVKLLSKKEIHIPEKTKIILLGANYIDTPIIITGNTIPLIVPLDENSSYYFKTIQAPNVKLMTIDDSGAHDVTLTTINNLDSIQKMFLKLLRKFPKVNNFFIEKLIVQLGDTAITTNKQNLNFAKDTPLEFKDVIIVPQDSLLYATYEEMRLSYNFVTKHWTELATPILDFQKQKDALRPSSLAVSNYSETPFNKTLIYEYLQRKDDLTALESWEASLSEEQQEKLKMLQKKYSPPSQLQPEIETPTQKKEPEPGWQFNQIVHRLDEQQNP